MMSNSKKHIMTQLIKVIIFVVLLIVLFYVGLMIGYGVVGEGNVKDIFSGNIWQHMKAFLEK